MIEPSKGTIPSTNLRSQPEHLNADNGWGEHKAGPPLRYRRYRVGILLVVIVSTCLIAPSGYLLLRHKHKRQWDILQRRLSATVPFFSNCRLEPLKRSPGLTVPAADFVSSTGERLATVMVRSACVVYVAFAAPGLRYRPATDAATQRLLDEQPAEAARRLRMIKHAIGAVSVLWPNLPANAIHVDDVQAIASTAREATVEMSIAVDGERIGAAVEVDLYHYRLLAIELRYNTRGL